MRISLNGQMPGCTLFFLILFFKCLLYFFLFFVATWADQDYISGSECVKRKVCCALSCLPMLVTLHFICMYASTCHKVCMLQTFWWQFSVLRIIVAQRLHSFSSLLVKSPKSRTRWSLLVTKGVIIFSRCSFSTTCSYLLHCLVSVFIHPCLSKSLHWINISEQCGVLELFYSKIFFFWKLLSPEDSVIYSQLIKLLKNSNFIHAFIFRMFTTLLTFLLSSSGPVFLQIIFGMQQFGNKVYLNTRGQRCLKKKNLHQWLKPDCEPYSLILTQDCPCLYFYIYTHTRCCGYRHNVLAY